ncbi:MAG: hypothetical protein JST86_12930 [Bacteroidetes bacterium]|nr:hypothetical protein [Bacteroidota bacterium]
MLKRFSPLAAVVVFCLVVAGCSKLDTTQLGSDLIPAVDNVTTFDTILNVNATQGVFDQDSTLILSTDNHALGIITNDPLFGTTNSNIYFQYKPTFFPFYWGNANDTINPSLAPGTGFDSVVLCLSYQGFWGDSTQPIQLKVMDIPNYTNNNGLWDSIGQYRNINYAPQVNAQISPTVSIDVRTLNNYTVYTNKKDSSIRQIRIKLNSSFANALYLRDTNLLGNNNFRNDTTWRVFNNGFAVIATGGNGIIYTNLTDSSSKLEVHYRRKNNGVLDTTYTAFRLIQSGTNPSVTANNIIRGRTGYPVLTPAPGEIYIQAQPGTYANIDIPGLAGVSNRIIHRAELIVEQIPDASSYLSPPSFLYVDLKDTSTTGNKWKPMYFDLNPSESYDPDFKTGNYYPTGGVDYTYHGGYAREKLDGFGNTIKYYNFNVSRYVQQILTKHTTSYQLRLYAPYQVEYPQYASPFDDAKRTGNNAILAGRVKVGSGSNANYKMRLRLVYSKI